MTWSDYEPSGVKDVWISIDSGDYVAWTAHEDDDWSFSMPADKSGHVIIEAWAEDNAGNQSYKAVILELVEGTVKSVRWLSTGGECVMLRIERPRTETTERPQCVMLPHECRRGQYATVL